MKQSLTFAVIDEQARGHALAWRLANCPEVNKVLLIRQNALFGACHPKMEVCHQFDEKRPDTYDLLVDFCQDKRIDCVIIGSTKPMVNALVDHFAGAGIPTLGAPKQSTRLETSKLFLKDLCQQYSIPNPDYFVCTKTAAVAELPDTSFPCYLKSDAMIRSDYSAVYVESRNSAIEVARRLFSNQEARYGRRYPIYAEELCPGKELSVTILLNNNSWCILPTVQDYKKLLDGDKGPNTGGMGAIATISEHSTIYKTIKAAIIEPTLFAIQCEGLSYTGFLYFGIILDNTGQPLLLELNCRLGDPEAQAISLLVEDDFAQNLYSAANQATLADTVRWRHAYAFVVYVVPLAYPEEAQTEALIDPHDFIKQTSDNNQVLYFWGHYEAPNERGKEKQWNKRLFCVAALGESVLAARTTVYSELSNLALKGITYRKDIGMVYDKNSQ